MAQFVSQPTPDEILPECCRTGFLFSGTPTGTHQSFGDIDVYVAKGADCCSQGKEDKAIVIFTDIFGNKFRNSQLMADAYAAGTGITVYIPDLMAGDAIEFGSFSASKDPMKEIVGPFISRNGDSKSLPLAEKFLDTLRATTPVRKIAGIGFCWGARYATLAAGNGKLDFLAMAHPSRLEVPQIFESIKVPTLFICAETDTQFPYPTAVEAAKEVYVKNNIPHEIHVYLGVSHGFNIRGDESNPVHKKAKIDATAAAIKFFQSHL